MERKIIITDDGSTTIHLPEWDEQYHSKFGALQEARHVFIQMGLFKLLEREGLSEISILEIGFGTGLNALVTWQGANKKKVLIEYTGVEAYPVSSEEVEHLNFAKMLEEPVAASVFEKMHKTEWETPQHVSEFFNLTKQQKYFQEINDVNKYDLIYFDAFGAGIQPDLWTEEIFEKMYKATRNNGILVTYAAKGSVRRAMLQVGFKVERLPGPPGKREMLRATKK
ncbi:MAG TPA: tRNA (5-methylaminomethyl-2-thiouridine)(34)-methyltransferase MnmD [Gillisia sp.]|nr:tRNA (5-methylaminomethyl-2-thiouridine)(34)-methyltransferase MnmD [Gillisia sp.]